jgi:hypothetical protein
MTLPQAPRVAGRTPEWVRPWARRSLQHLFAPVPPARVTWRGAVLATVAVMAGALVSLARQPGLGALDTAYDEDARIFLADAAALPVAESFLAPYQGYYHLTPRLLAEIAVLFPPAWAAAVMATLAATTISLLALFVFVASRAHLPAVPLRLLASVPVVTLPVAQSEVPNALANLHWPLLYATAWALLWVPRRTAGRVVALVIAAMTVTSDLLALAFLPLLAARLLVRRDRHSAAMALVVLAGLTVQFGAYLINDHPRELGPPRFDPAWALASFATRPVPQALLGDRLVSGDPRSTGYVVAVAAAWLMVLGLVILALRGWTRPDWAFTLVMSGLAAILYVQTVMAGGVAVPRYAFAPALMVLAALAGLIAPATPGSPATPDRPTVDKRLLRLAPMVALLALAAAVAVTNLRLDNPRAAGPSWQESIAGAQATCRTVGPGATVTIRVAPLAAHAYAQLPCDYLLARPAG